VAARISVVVVGAGHAGLAVSYELTHVGVEHLVLEQARTGESWRTRWDSFCLVTPNRAVQLPGGAYEGEDPDGFMPRDEIVAHLERYASSPDRNVRVGIAATRMVWIGSRLFRKHGGRNDDVSWLAG
jgi:putative flavoprotein involved in K+ transport